jgi:Tfp pilus assembly protein PilF
LENFRESAGAFARLLELDERHIPGYNNLGVLYAALHEHTKALHVLQQGLELEPENPVLLFNYAAVLDARGRFKEAIEAYQKAVHYRPQWTEALHNLGIVLCERDQHERALEIFTRIAKDNPGNGRILNSIGVTLLDQGRGEEAAQYFTQSLEADPGYATAEANLKRAFQKSPPGNRDFKQAFDPEDMAFIADQPPALAGSSAPVLPEYSEQARAENAPAEIEILEEKKEKVYETELVSDSIFSEKTEKVYKSDSVFSEKAEKVYKIKNVTEKEYEIKNITEKKWEFNSVTVKEVLALLKYLLYLVDFLPPRQQETFSHATVRSDLEYLIDSLEVMIFNSTVPDRKSVV